MFAIYAPRAQTTVGQFEVPARLPSVLSHRMRAVPTGGAEMPEPPIADFVREREEGWLNVALEPGGRESPKLQREPGSGAVNHEGVPASCRT
jgi:hypothetical protein